MYFELNECLSYIISDIFSGVAIQNIEYLLVYKYETFWDNLELIIKKYFSSFHYSFPGVASPLKTKCLVGLVSMILLTITSRFRLNCFLYFTQMIGEIVMNLYT